MKRYFPFIFVTICTVHLVACKPAHSPEENLIAADTIVVYECNERLFANNNCFQAIQNYLPTLQELEVNVLWLMPIHPRGTVKSVGSPYCVRDYLLIDSKFGTMEDFDALVADAHSRGMRVMLDWVANHTAWDHPWYKTHPEWYTTPEGEEKNWNDVVPLDYGQQVVCDTMLSVMKYWVNRGVDGFRCDYAHGVPTDFWQMAIDNLRTIKPDLIMLAETSKAAYYRAGFDWLYSWDYLSAIQNLFKEGKGVSSLMRVNKNEYKSTPEGKERLRYITTHDASSENAPKTFYKSADAALAAACLTYFLAGVPMIYSSQELGYLEKINFFDFKKLSFDSDSEILHHWEALMHAWKDCVYERYGEVVDYSTDEVAIFTRSQEGHSLLVAVNVTNQAVTINVPDEFIGKQVKDKLHGELIQLNNTIDLPGYGYMLLTKN